jgi:prephenate dehydratase
MQLTHSNNYFQDYDAIKGKLKNNTRFVLVSKKIEKKVDLSKAYTYKTHHYINPF